MPFFSVLMPTRNRASLLRSALETAVGQDFQDYEIIVSDNNSTDDTRAVVADFANSTERIKYVNPGRDLSMCDNWEYVLSQAAGRYVIYLCDDDAFTRKTLSYVHELLTHFGMDVLVWRYAGYHHPDIPDKKLRLGFSYDHRSGNLYEILSTSALQTLCGFDWSVNGVVPKMLNCAVARETLETHRSVAGQFFVPPYPDYSAAGQLLSTQRSYYVIDLPLYVSGASYISNAGILFERKKKIDEYVSLFGRDLLEGVPYQMRYLTNSYFYATWLLFQRIYPKTFTADIDVGAYLKSMFAELTMFEGYDDLTAEFELLSEHMRSFSGGPEMFERLWQEHEQAKKNGDGNGGVARLKKRAWGMVRRNERAFNLLARARGHRITDSYHKNVRSIGAAAQMLCDYLATRARPARELNPILIDSPELLRALR